MKPFGYLRDRLFLIACSLYAGNRWLIKPHTHNVLLRFHFNDLLLIPCALPPLLLIQRRLKLRLNDDVPAWSEIALYLVVWSILFEAIGPHIMPWTTGDWQDVIAYTAGGILAGLWWQRSKVFSVASLNEL